MMIKTTFSELIKQKEMILTRLYSVSITQLELVRSGDISRLLDFLLRKQQIVNEFDELEQRLIPHRNIPPEQRQWNCEQERIKTGETINRCSMLLEQIIENDRLSTEEMAEQKNDVEMQLKRIQQTVKVNSSYAKQAIPVNPTQTIRRFDVSK